MNVNLLVSIFDQDTHINKYNVEATAAYVLAFRSIHSIHTNTKLRAMALKLTSISSGSSPLGSG